LATFDSFVQSANSVGNLSRSFGAVTKCSQLNENNLDYRFARAFVCGVSLSTSQCPRRVNANSNVCKDTCVKSVESLRGNLAQVCGNTPEVTTFIAQRLKQCDAFPSDNCVDGGTIQKNNCGKSDKRDSHPPFIIHHVYNVCLLRIRLL
jgi:hypothetical protein